MMSLLSDRADEQPRGTSTGDGTVAVHTSGGRRENGGGMEREWVEERYIIVNIIVRIMDGE